MDGQGSRSDEHKRRKRKRKENKREKERKTENIEQKECKKKKRERKRKKGRGGKQSTENKEIIINIWESRLRSLFNIHILKLRPTNKLDCNIMEAFDNLPFTGECHLLETPA